MTLVLLTRPEKQSQKLAETLRLPCVIEPMLKIEPVPVSISWSKFQDFIVTSAQVFDNLDDLPPHGRYWCVGSVTAQRARDYGLCNIVTGPGTAEGLMELIGEDKTSKTASFLYLRGQDITLPMADILRQEQICVEEVIVYSSQERATISPELKDHLLHGRISLIPFFSAKTAHTFVRLIQEAHLTSFMTCVTALALSQKIKQILNVFTWQNIHLKDTLANNIIEEYYELTLDKSGDKL